MNLHFSKLRYNKNVGNNNTVYEQVLFMMFSTNDHTLLNQNIHKFSLSRWVRKQSLHNSKQIEMKREKFS